MPKKPHKKPLPIQNSDKPINDLHNKITTRSLQIHIEPTADSYESTADYYEPTAILHQLSPSPQKTSECLGRTIGRRHEAYI